MIYPLELAPPFPFVVSDLLQHRNGALTITSCNFQQQQQHSLLSQASWGRPEMEPKRHKGHGSGTLIASLQALLSKANSSEISQSLRSLLTDSSQVS